MKTNRLRIMTAAAICLAVLKCGAQPAALTLQQADSLFLARNCEVLAARYGIEQADAQTIQARLFDNPVVSLDENVYNRLNGKYFDFGNTSEQVVGIDQLISIAGQHANAVRLAKLSGQAARETFDELVRNLRGSLHCTFIRLYFAQQNLEVFRHEIISLHRVLDALALQEEKGNISKIETARIRALLLSLQQEQNQYATQEADLQAQLRMYAGIPADTRMQAAFNPNAIDTLSSDSSPAWDALQSFLTSRPDVRLAQTGADMAGRKVKLQRSKAFPEVHLRGQYDRNAGYFPNYFSAGISLTIPIFNHNQGNIHSAKAEALQAQCLFDQTLQQARNDLAVAIDKLHRALALSATVSRDFHPENMENLFKGVNENYKKRNISLLEFVDFYRTYKDAMLQTADIRQEAFIAMEELNTAVGQTVIRY